MVKCKEFVKTVSSNLDNSWKSKINMWIHYFICISCRRYVRQLSMLKIKYKEYFSCKKQMNSDDIKKIEDKVIKTLLEDRSNK